MIEGYPDMKPWVIHNKAVPLSILETLSTDPDADVRAWVATKRKLSRELFERLAADPETGVRSSIVLNRKTPLDILEPLTGDPVEWLAESARERIAYRRQECERVGRVDKSNGPNP